MSLCLALPQTQRLSQHMMSSLPNPYVFAVGVGFALAGAACDLRCRRIPNRLTAAAVAIALVGGAWDSGIHGFLGSLAAGLVATVIFAVMFFMGGMGGGDVKLMAAVAAFAGLSHLTELLLVTTLAGGAFAVALAAAHGALGATLRGALGWFWPRNTLHTRSLECAHLSLPYGVPIAVGALVTFYRGVIAS
jgi:prepilin peptidase CpaA